MALTDGGWQLGTILTRVQMVFFFLESSINVQIILINPAVIIKLDSFQFGIVACIPCITCYCSIRDISPPHLNRNSFGSILINRFRMKLGKKDSKNKFRNENKK